jgi:hypothetical protein
MKENQTLRSRDIVALLPSLARLSTFSITIAVLHEALPSARLFDPAYQMHPAKISQISLFKISFLK